jgi:quinohemoprotein ethanol dehydrogenase
VRGYITAYDAETGKQAWRFYTVPGDPQKGFETKTVEMIAKTWSGEWWKQGGGGTVWDSMAYDPELDLLYIGVGNGSSWSWKLRSENKGDNLFLASIVAIRPDSGDYVWHFQTTPGDDWDYTATQHMILADLIVEGEPRKVIMQAPKNGFFYVLDRQTGEFLSGTPYVATSWASGLDPKGRPIVNPEARYGITGKPALVTPGPLGGHNWQPMSFSPNTGLVYIPGIETAFPYHAVDPKTYTRRTGGFWNIGLDPVVASIPHDEAIRKAVRAASKGRLIAWDPVLRTAEWTIEYPVPWNGGLLSTAGSLLFQGTGTGKFVAYEARGGRKLWEFDAQTGIIAAPVSYEVDGEQYVTILAGWGGAAPNAAGEITMQAASGGTNRVLTFRLGAKATLPPRTTTTRALNLPPDTPPTKEAFERGLVLYQVNCMICHGDTGVSGGVVPDLRYSATLGSSEAWKAIVLDGSMVNNGMVKFDGILKRDEMETIRAYVIQRAHDEKARLASP